MSQTKVFQDWSSKLKHMTPEQRLNAFLKGPSLPKDQERFLSLFVKQTTLRSVEKVSATNTIVTYAFKVDRFYCNVSGNLHGGAQSAMYDMLTSLSMLAVTDSGPWVSGGVSRVLTVTYLRPAPEGDELLMECEMTHIGKQLAFLRGSIKRERDGAVVSTCEHNKVNIGIKKDWKL